MDRLFRLIYLALILMPALSAYAEISPNGFQYTISADGLYYLYVAKKAQVIEHYELVDADYTENLIVPDCFNDIPVTTVANFNNRVDIETVSFGANVTTVNFTNCEYIHSIDFGSAVNVSGTIRNLSALKSLVAPLRTDRKASPLYIYNCNALETVSCAGNTTLNFVECPKLSQVSFAEGMTQLPTFRNCTALNNVLVPASVEVLAGNFTGCSAMDNFTLAPDSKLEVIGSNTFSQSGIKRFKAPESLKAIGQNSFNFTPIEEFSIPPDLVKGSYRYNFDDGGYIQYYSCGDMASILDGCPELKRIDYSSQDQVLTFPPCLKMNYNIWKHPSDVELYVDGKLLTELTIPSNYAGGSFKYTSGLKKVTFANSTASLDLYECFADIHTLESVEIGAGAPKLSYTFQNCTNLKTVTVSAKNKTKELQYTFKGCSSLQTISFPEVTVIEMETFKDCTSLESVDFPALEKITEGAFSNCASLKEVHFPLLQFSSESDGQIFEGCTSLKVVDMPMVETLPRQSFRNCSSLEQVNMPSLKFISYQVFENCASLRSFDFSNILKIGSDAFDGTGLQEMILPLQCIMNSGIKNCAELRRIRGIANGKFINLPKLELIDLYGDDTSWQVTISDCMQESEGQINIHGNIWSLSLINNPNLKRLNVEGELEFCVYGSSIPKEFGVRSISEYLRCTSRNQGFTVGDDAPGGSIDFFVGDDRVSDIVIPAGSTVKPRFFKSFNINSVTFLGGESTAVQQYAFQNCKYLTDIKFADNSDVSIGEEAFASCGFEKVTLTPSVTSLARLAFAYNPKLKKVIFNNHISHIPDGLLYDCPLLEQVIIPEGTISMGYKITEARWNPAVKLISLPSTLEQLYPYNNPTFAGLPTDVEILSWAKTPPNGNLDSFAGNMVHVPVGCADAYSKARIWQGAEIIDDLLVDTGVGASDDNVTITVPINSHISNDAQPESYEVDCYLVGDETDTLIDTYYFNADGTPASSKSRAGEPTSLRLEIDGLAQNSLYRFDLRGYTSDHDLVYTHNVQAQTLSSSSASSPLIGNSIEFKGGNLVIGASYSGMELYVYDLDGHILVRSRIPNGGDNIRISLEPGIYVIAIGPKSLKLKI